MRRAGEREKIGSRCDSVAVDVARLATAAADGTVWAICVWTRASPLSSDRRHCGRCSRPSDGAPLSPRAIPAARCFARAQLVPHTCGRRAQPVPWCCGAADAESRQPRPAFALANSTCQLSPPVRIRALALSLLSRLRARGQRQGGRRNRKTDGGRRPER
eukprot:365442-Chlamydomonas_euryale.AAC.6